MIPRVEKSTFLTGIDIFFTVTKRGGYVETYVRLASELRFLLEFRILMRFLAYLIGFLIFIGGLAWAALEAGAPRLYVMIGAVILLGLGIIMGASRSRRYRHGGDITVVRDDDLI